ncbi:MAG: hypothetical protein IJ012_04525, partial [Clostridia bacterium]|nr:hypothetical protein [Clostridia bacterium]
NENGPTPPTGMQNAAPYGVGYYFFVPDGWTVDRRGEISIASLSPYSSVSLSAVSFASDKTVEDYYAESRTENEAKFAEITVLEDGKDTTLDNVAAKRYAFSGKYHDGNIYCFMQCIAKKDGHLYVLTYTASESEYNEYLSGIGEILATFHFDAESTLPAPEKQETTDGAPEGMKQISIDGIHAYRFYVPTDWVTDMQTGVVSAYASETDRTSVSIHATYPPSGIQTVADYFASMEAERRTLLSDYRVLVGADEKDEIPIADGKGQRFVYEGTNGGVTYRISQIFFVRGTYVYTFTYTARAEVYEQHEATVEKILAAFSFEK